MRTATLMICCGMLMTSGSWGRAEIVERDLGTDTSGKPVTGYVFQAGRSHRASASLRRSSGLQSRRAVRRPAIRSGGYVERGYYGFPYWYVPVIPLHCGGSGVGGYFSLWRGSPSGVSITVIR